MLGLMSELYVSQLAQMCSISCIHAIIKPAGILLGGDCCTMSAYNALYSKCLIYFNSVFLFCFLNKLLQNVIF